MKKLKAILQIIFADKWAVFTYENVIEDSEKMTAPYFKWNISEKCDYFFNLIKDKISDIEKSM